MAISKRARAALKGVEDVEWCSFSHPYGVAEDVPGYLHHLLSEPDTDDALEAGTFFHTYFVCQGVHFGDAAIPAIPFLLRLLAAPGVSRRGDVAAALLEMLRISVSPDNASVDAALKDQCLDAFAREAKTVLRAARFLDGTEFERAAAALVVAFADVVARCVRSGRAPPFVLDAITQAGTLSSPQARLHAWAGGGSCELQDLLDETIAGLPDDWSPSDGEDPSSDVARDEPVAPPTETLEARWRSECDSTELMASLEGDRAVLTEMFLRLRLAAGACKMDATLQGARSVVEIESPAVVDGERLVSSVVLRARADLRPNTRDLPIDGWVEQDERGVWLSLLMDRASSFLGFTRTCAFLLSEAERLRG